jgi:type I restriction enzyme R subunit
MLEIVRRRFRSLIKLIEKKQRKPIYTDFEDELGTETVIDLPQFASPDSFERFRSKTRQFLREHENELVIHKLRMNEPLTVMDLQELEQILMTEGLSHPEHLAKAKAESQGLGLFVRSLVGLDREAAKQALSGFLAGKALTANQIEFVNLIVEHLTEHGVMDARLLYESPFTDLSPLGPEGVFNPAQVSELVILLSQVRARAVA